MATTTARLNLTSTDLLSDVLSLNVTESLNAAGTTVGLKKTGGLRRQTMASTSEILLLSKASYIDNTSNWLYIKNTSVTLGRYVDVFVGTIGTSLKLSRIYQDEWGFIPFAGNEDINLQVSNTDIIVEWMLINE